MRVYTYVHTYIHLGPIGYKQAQHEQRIGRDNHASFVYRLHIRIYAYVWRKQLADFIRT
jgi:hypothetical protein